MKYLWVKSKKVLSNSRGESLLEGVISILLLTILVATVTMMIMTSLRVTHRSIDSADTMQDIANDTGMLNTGNTVGAVAGTHAVVFTVVEGVAGSSSVSIPVDVFEAREPNDDGSPGAGIAVFTVFEPIEP